MIKVSGHSDLARDPISGAIININRDEITTARERKKTRAKKDREDKQLKADVRNLQNELGDIKQLLAQIVEKI
tara:strand:+ start:3041 stop:3259 length:219 start_codon:yes stop_codon:yes gene_type:complete